MTAAARKFFNGEQLSSNELPMYLYEHIIASHYHWSLEAIRQMDLQDFYVHLRICLVREDIEREFQAKLAGATFGETAHIVSDGDGEQISGQLTERKKLKSGAVTETRTQKSRLRNEVGGMKINTRTGEVVEFSQPTLPDKV